MDLVESICSAGETRRSLLGFHTKRFKKCHIHIPVRHCMSHLGKSTNARHMPGKSKFDHQGRATTQQLTSTGMILSPQVTTLAQYSDETRRTHSLSRTSTRQLTIRAVLSNLSSSYLAPLVFTLDQFRATGCRRNAPGWLFMTWLFILTRSLLQGQRLQTAT